MVVDACFFRVLVIVDVFSCVTVVVGSCFARAGPELVAAEDDFFGVTMITVGLPETMMVDVVVFTPGGIVDVGVLGVGVRGRSEGMYQVVVPEMKSVSALPERKVVVLRYGDGGLVGGGSSAAAGAAFRGAIMVAAGVE
ncbi:MAG: hypothetical protein Q9193_005992 [Seirophora villosa]